MPIGSYTCNREFTEEQREADSDHGIFESQTRCFQFSENAIIKYAYHYYYEYENSLYVMVKQQSTDIQLSGTYLIEGEKIICTITAGSQKAQDIAHYKNISNNSDITGNIVLIQDGNNLKVLQVSLSAKELNRGQLALNTNLVFKKNDKIN